jgi:predicted metallopeptidase
MPIEYSQAPDVKMLADEIVESLGLYHIVPQFVHCVRSRGSASRRTIARIHGFGKIWQETLHLPASYLIEVISERYDKQSEEDKEKTTKATSIMKLSMTCTGLSKNNEQQRRQLFEGHDK